MKIVIEKTYEIQTFNGRCVEVPRLAWGEFDPKKGHTVNFSPKCPQVVCGNMDSPCVCRAFADTIPGDNRGLFGEWERLGFPQLSECAKSEVK